LCLSVNESITSSEWALKNQRSLCLNGFGLLQRPPFTRFFHPAAGAIAQREFATVGEG